MLVYVLDKKPGSFNFPVSPDSKQTAGACIALWAIMPGRH